MSLTRSLFNPRSLMSGFDDVFAAPFFSDIPATPLVVVNRDPSMILRRSSPCYEVTENDDAYHLYVDVPGVKGKDITAEVEQDGKVLHIAGGRKVHTTGPDGNEKVSESKFEKKFGLDHSVDPSNITANLSEGVLTIVAPKLKKEMGVHTISISESPSR
eukprot:55912_1